jgi:hypothetical protein
VLTALCPGGIAEFLGGQQIGENDIISIIVGLPDAAVKESRDRVTTALTNSGFRFPMGRSTINLAPADVKKEGPSFDLPIAVGMLAASDQLNSDELDNFIMVGELALTGAVRPVKGVSPCRVSAVSSVPCQSSLLTLFAVRREGCNPHPHPAFAPVGNGLEISPWAGIISS